MFGLDEVYKNVRREEYTTGMITEAGRQRKELVILNYQYWIPTFLKTILYYAVTVYDKVYFLYPVAGTEKQIHSHRGRIFFIGIPRKNAFRYIVKLPIYFTGKDTREQLKLAIRHKLPLMKFLESVAVYNTWADVLEKAVSGLFKRDLIRKENTVVMAAWFSAEAGAGARIKMKYPEVRFVSLAHSYEVDRKKNPYAEYDCNGMIHHYCDHIYFISELLMKQYYGNACIKKSSVMHLGIRKLYPERRVPGSADGSIRLLSCSDMGPVKRIDRIIDALGSWEGSNIEWTHFGEGPLLEEMKKRAEQVLGNKHNVRFRFMGQVKNRVIHEYYNTQTVDLFVNVSEAEGLPISLMECMSYGVPAIVTKAGGNTELVTESAGFLLDVDFSDEELCGAIKSYIEMDHKEQEKMRTSAYERWKEYFDASVNIVRLLREMRG